LLDDVEPVDQLRANVLLLYLITTHGSYDCQRFLPISKVVTHDAEIVSTGGCQFEYRFFPHFL
jgi:hypothetical protein